MESTQLITEKTTELNIHISKRQEEIIEAAGKILSNAGISGLTTKNLAKEMHFTESALYRHFKNKEAIIITMLEYLALNMQQRFLSSIDAKQTPEEKFIALFNTQFVFFSEKPYFVVAVFTDTLTQESAAIKTAIKKIMSVKFTHLSAIIKQGQAQNIFINTITNKQLVHIVMGAFRLLVFKWHMDNFKSNIHSTGTEMIQSLLTLIKQTGKNA